MALPSKKVVARGLKRKTHTLQTKYDAILEVEKGEKTKTQVAADLGIPLNTLSTWIGKADEYRRPTRTRPLVQPPAHEDGCLSVTWTDCP